MECSCPFCPVYEYIGENGDLCLSVKTKSNDNYESNIQIAYHLPSTPESQLDSLNLILHNFMTAHKINPKTVQYRNSVTTSMTGNSNNISYFYSLQRLSKKKEGECLWKFCIHKEHS